MTMRFAGVALAAVVGACALGGGVERAEASVIFNAAYSGQSDISGGSAVSIGTFSFDSAKGQLVYDYSTRYDLYMLDPEQDYTVRTSGSLIVDSYSFRSTGYQAGYQIFNLSFMSSQITASVDAAYDNGTLVPLFFSEFITAPVIGVNAQINSASIISTVPLPSTAPLFGAALFVLGGATYARRRAKIAAA